MTAPCRLCGTVTDRRRTSRPPRSARCRGPPRFRPADPGRLGRRAAPSLAGRSAHRQRVGHRDRRPRNGRRSGDPRRARAARPDRLPDSVELHRPRRRGIRLESIRSDLPAMPRLDQWPAAIPIRRRAPRDRAMSTASSAAMSRSTSIISSAAGELSASDQSLTAGNHIVEQSRKPVRVNEGHHRMDGFAPSRHVSKPSGEFRHDQIRSPGGAGRCCHDAATPALPLRSGHLRAKAASTIVKPLTLPRPATCSSARSCRHRRRHRPIRPGPALRHGAAPTA